MTVPPGTITALGDRAAMVVADVSDRKMGPATAARRMDELLAQARADGAAAEHARWVKALSGTARTALPLSVLSLLDGDPA